MCLAHHLWLDLSESIYNYLNNISLAEVISRQEIRRLAYEQDAPRFEKETHRIDLQITTDPIGREMRTSQH